MDPTVNVAIKSVNGGFAKILLALLSIAFTGWAYVVQEAAHSVKDQLAELHHADVEFQKQREIRDRELEARLTRLEANQRVVMEDLGLEK